MRGIAPGLRPKLDKINKIYKMRGIAPGLRPKLDKINKIYKIINYIKS